MRSALIPILFIVLLSCTAGNSKPDRPDWIENPGNGAVGSSTTHVRGRYYQEELAITRARERLAAQYGVEISSIHTIKEQVVNDQAYVVSKKQIEQTLNKTSVKAHVRAIWRDVAHDEIWVWIYPVNE